MTNNQTPKRKSFKAFLVVAVLVLAVLFLLQKFGNVLVKTTTHTEIDHNPRNEPLDFEEFKQIKDKQRKERQTRKSLAENRLMEFVQDYRKTGKKDLRASEVSFLQKVDAKAKKEQPSSNFKDYAQYMNHALTFYKTVKELKKSSDKIQDYTQKFLEKDQKELEKFSKQNPSQEDWLDFIEK